MIGEFLNAVTIFEDLLWGYICVPLFLFAGLYLSWKGRFLQIRAFPRALTNFFTMMRMREQKEGDVHPLKAFFACVGGCIGIGNIVAVCTAIQIGGPGALFWLWVTAILGTMLKYAEVYLGMRYRVRAPCGALQGGPIYFLRHAFSSPIFSIAVGVLLCIYGVEVFQFSIVASSFVHNFSLSPYIVVPVLLVLVLLAASGGVHRVGAISSAIVPIFTLIYISMGIWVFFLNFSLIPSILAEVFYAAFTPSSAVGGFVGTTLMMTISQGVRRGCYTGDFGIGYASVIHSASMEESGEKQASLVFIDTFLDTFVICTTTLLVILITDVWKADLPTAMLVQEGLSVYFPYMEYFMPLFLFLLGYSTINAYFCVGLKSAEVLFPRYGKSLFFAYGIIAFILFSFMESTLAQSVMATVGGLLLLINSIGILKLSHQLSFDVPRQSPTPALQTQEGNAAL